MFQNLFMRKYLFGISTLFILSFTYNTVSVEAGKATYYADKFHGRKTSSGEVFDQKMMTAAHKTLPFGTLVSVRNTTNDSIVVVKINDRLPKNSAFVIDLSLSAAKQLNFIRQGIAKVEVSAVTNFTE